jgi:hypothetical protein
MKEASEEPHISDDDKEISDEENIAVQFQEILAPFKGGVTQKRMALWLKKLGRNAKDEVLQFRVLQRACSENEELKAAFEAAGFGDITEIDTIHVTPQTARLIQAFNHMIESRWLRHF